eukprot:1162057-Pelagomonas_calceolata.AAC.3
MLEPLVSPVHGLPRFLQEYLIHILLNHERHHTDLSVRALRLRRRGLPARIFSLTFTSSIHTPPSNIPEKPTPSPPPARFSPAPRLF